MVEIISKEQNYMAAKRWIPVTKALPDYVEEGNVLVTVSGVYGQVMYEDAIMVADYYGEDEGWCIEGYPDVMWNDKNVTAWMPLPVPYEEIKNE